MGKKSEKKKFIIESLCCTPETNTHINQAHVNRKIKHILEMMPHRYMRSSCILSVTAMYSIIYMPCVLVN